jgi:hypothetical protein
MSGKRIGYTGQGTVRSPELRWRVDRRRATDPGEEERRDLQVGHSCCTKESDKYPPHRETDESNPAERKSRETARPRRQRGADHEFRTSPARSKSSRSVRTATCAALAAVSASRLPFARSPNFSFPPSPGQSASA